MSDNIKFSKHKEIKWIGYKEYDNYKAIEIPYTDAIPSDYEWIMWVPISFLNKYNSEQFEIVASDYQIKEWLYPELIREIWHWKIDRWYINWERIYARILIRHKK